MDHAPQRARTEHGLQRSAARKEFLGVPRRAWILGWTLGIIGFFLTLWLTQPAPPAGSGIAAMTRTPVADNAGLLAATDAAGLKASPVVRGNIDTVKRIDGGQVTISGWAAQINGKGSPLAVLAFPDLQHVYLAETKGERPDVTSTLRLRSGAAANVAFELVVTCSPGRPMPMIAATQDNLFTPLESPPCP